MDHEGILNRLPVVVYLLDSASGDVLYLSEGVRRYLGHVPDDLRTSTAEWRGRVHPDDVNDVPTLDEPTRAAGRPFEAEYRMLTAAEEIVWVREEAVLVPGDGAHAPFWQGTVMDITARKEVEEASWRSSLRFRAILEELPAIVYMNSLDIPPKTTYISPRLEAILGVKPEEWVENRRLWMDLAHPDDLERMMAEDVAHYPDGRYLSEFRMVARDGRVVWFHDEAVLVKDEDGNPTHWEGVLVDISDQKAAEERLREAEERFRILVEKGSAIVYIDEAAPPSNTIYMSPQVFELFGWTQEEYLREQDLWEKALHPDDRERVLTEDALKGETGETTSIEYRLINARGETIWIQERSNLLRDADGSPLCWMGVMLDITEQKRSEADVRKADARYRNLIEQLPVATYSQPYGAVSGIFMSPQIEEITGWPVTAFERAETWNAVVHPEDEVLWTSAWADLEDASPEPFDAQYRIVKPDGTVVWVHDVAVLIEATEDAPATWQGVIQDITELKRTEAELERARESWRTLVDQTPTPIYIEEPHSGVTTYISPLIEKVLGYTPEEWTSRASFFEGLLHPDDKERVIAADNRASETLEPYDVDYRAFHKDGHVVWLHDEAVVVRDEQGEPLYWVGVHRDITMRKEAEEQLREAEQRHRSLIEQIPAILVVYPVGLGTLASYVSPYSETLLGYAPEDWYEYATFWYDRLHPDDAARTWRQYEAALEELDDYSLEYRMIHKEGHAVWVEERGTFLRDENGDPMFVQSVIFDVTERKLAEEMSAELAAQTYELGHLRELDDMKSAFMSAVSHELRTPLTSMLGGALTLQAAGHSLPQKGYEDILNMIVAGGHRMGKLLTDLLDIERLSRGATTLQSRKGDVGEVVRGVVQECRALDGHPVELDLASVWLRFDSVRVERIVDNLLTNADRHTPEGTPVRVSLRSYGDAALIVVEDEGPGVPDDLKTVVFEAFRQGSAPEESPGIGVGLALVAKLAELHGGRAWVEDREGGGASFHVVLSSLAEDG